VLTTTTSRRQSLNPGLALTLLTHPVNGLKNYAEMMKKLTEKGSVQVFMNVADR
jgi:hypothetical protein